MRAGGAGADQAARSAGHPGALGSAWRVAFNFAWSVAFLVALLATSLGVDVTLKRYRNPGWSALGLVVPDDQRLHIIATLTPEASAIAPGSVILAVDNARVSPNTPPLTIRQQLQFPENPRSPRIENSLVPVVTQTAGEPPVRRWLHWQSANAEIPYAGWFSLKAWLIEQLVVGLPPTLLLIIAAMVLRRSGRKEPLAALLSLSLLLVAASNFISEPFWLGRGLSGAKAVLDDLGWFGIFLALLLPLKDPLKPRWLWAVAMILLLPWVYDAFWGLGALKILIHIQTFGIGVAIVAMRYQGAFRQERRRVWWLLLGFAAGTFVIAIGYAIDNDYLLHAFTPRQKFVTAYPLYAIGTCLYVAGLLVAVQKYGLYDADSFLTRSAVYSALIVLAAMLYALASAVLNPLLDQWFGGTAPWPSKLVAPVLIAAVVAPLRQAFEKWGDRRFRRQLTDLADRLPREIAELSAFVSRDELLELVLARVEQDTRAMRSAILIGGVPAASRHVPRERVLDWADRALPGGATPAPTFDPGDGLFPVRVALGVSSQFDDAPLGWLLVGPRSNGTLFGADEREALQGLARPIARAVTMIRMRELGDARLVALEKGLARVARQLSGAGRPARS